MARGTVSNVGRLPCLWFTSFASSIFEGKWAIHPSQIELANEVYTPPESEVSHAKQILIALDEAAKAGRGAAQLNGRMIDAASAKMAENIVNTDNAIQGKLKG